MGAKKQAEIEAQLKAEIEAQEKAAEEEAALVVPEVEAEPVPEVKPVEEEAPVLVPQINETTSNDSSDSEPEIKIIEKIEKNLKEELDKNIPDLKIPEMD